MSENCPICNYDDYDKDDGCPNCRHYDEDRVKLKKRQRRVNDRRIEERRHKKY